jgi:heme ABC exporter ATP-binding subunit CcmA
MIRNDSTELADPLLRLESLGKVFGHFRALSDVTWDLYSGECLLLLGSNGAGKTTLLKILAGLTRPTAGTFFIQGCSGLKLPFRTRRQIGFLSHTPQLYAELSARENLLFFGKLYGISPLEERVVEVLTQVNMEDRADDPVRYHSRGMQQRISIAKALLHDPPLLLLDEPYSGLDAAGVQRLNRLLERFHDRGTTMILTTHQLEAAVSFADKTVILQHGYVRFQAAKKDLQGNPDFTPVALSVILEKYL